MMVMMMMVMVMMIMMMMIMLMIMMMMMMMHTQHGTTGKKHHPAYIYIPHLDVLRRGRI